jgi:FkbM family methyltransferase
MIPKAFKPLLSRMLDIKPISLACIKLAEIASRPVGQISFSQEAEDLILLRWIKLLDIANGFFVEIGSGHPIRFSNTIKLERCGWQGVTVDANPEFDALYTRFRKSKHFVRGVGLKHSSLTYFRFETPELNTFSSEVCAERVRKGWPIRDSLIVSIEPLDSILASANAQTEFDLLAIDVEGKDFEVLQSLNIEKWRPKIVVCEILLNEAAQFEALLEGYFLVSTLLYSHIFIRNDLAEKYVAFRS